MHGKVYDFSSTQINLPFSLSTLIVNWGTIHLSNDIIFQVDGNYGRENEIHITLLYGLLQDKPEEVEKYISRFNSFKVQLGKVSKFDNNPKFDVVKIDVISDELVKLNSLLKVKFRHANRYPVYHPHVTIAYINKGEDCNFDKEAFEGTEFEVKSVIYSSKDGVKTPIFLR